MPTKLDFPVLATIPTGTDRNIESLHARTDGVHAVSRAAQDSGLLTLMGRQGGSTTNWTTDGTTNYPPVAARVQIGVVNVDIPSGVGGTSVVTFPVAYLYPPHIQLTVNGLNINGTRLSHFTATSTGGASFNVTVTCEAAVGGPSFVIFFWTAIGAESA